jgi:hypothetical protein
MVAGPDRVTRGFRPAATPGAADPRAGPRRQDRPGQDEHERAHVSHAAASSSPAGPARPRPAARPGTWASSAASSRNSQPGNSANSCASTAPASTPSPTSPRSSPSPAPRSTAPFNEGSAIQAAPVWTARRQARLARSATLDLGQPGVAGFCGLLATENGGSTSGLPGGTAPFPVARWRAPGRGAAAAAGSAERGGGGGQHGPQGHPPRRQPPGPRPARPCTTSTRSAADVADADSRAVFATSAARAEAGLLPRILKGRKSRPVFVTGRKARV